MTDLGTAVLLGAAILVLHLIQAADRRSRRTGRVWRDGSPVRPRARLR